jgi:hypothetical protein
MLSGALTFTETAAGVADMKHKSASLGHWSALANHAPAAGRISAGGFQPVKGIECAVGGIGGLNTYDFDFVDRDGVALARPQNESSFGNQPQICRPSNPPQSMARKAVNRPLVRSASKRRRRGWPSTLGGIPPNTPQTRRPLRELIFT